jgi:hypothetical protein
MRKWMQVSQRKYQISLVLTSQNIFEREKEILRCRETRARGDCGGRVSCRRMRASISPPLKNNSQHERSYTQIHATRVENGFRGAQFFSIYIKVCNSQCCVRMNAGLASSFIQGTLKIHGVYIN